MDPSTQPDLPAQATYWDGGRPARNRAARCDIPANKSCSRFALIAGETPAVPVFTFECLHPLAGQAVR
ncbi:MAG: hypothetical protein ACREBG_16510 [Pyrinomonadaceae bacterium]